MNKTILLELTEKEAEVVNRSLIREKDYWSAMGPEVSGVLIENNLTVVVDVVKKLWASNQPQEDVLIQAKDFLNLIAMARKEFLRLNGDLHISNKKVEQKDLVHISVANSLIVWLNGKNLLKKLVKFDYTDHSCDYEEMD
jgi:hypothetical protein